MKRFDIICVAFGVFLAAVSIWLGTYDPLWQWIGVPEALRGSLTTAVSIFILLVAFLLSFYSQQSLMLRQIYEVTSGLPHVEFLESMNGNEAFLLLTMRISEAKSVLNTRLFPGDSRSGYSENTMAKWQAKIRSGIRSGLVFRDVLSPGLESTARECLAEYSGRKGMYEAVVVSSGTAPMMNFTVLTLSDGTKEVWFGWVMSPGYGFDQPCFRSRDARLTGFFEKWFAELFSSGSHLTYG